MPYFTQNLAFRHENDISSLNYLCVKSVINRIDLKHKTYYAE